MSATRGDRQSAEYAFPYHHLPHIDAGGMPHVGRSMRGGMEYLAYLRAVVDVVRTLSPHSLLDVGCGDGRLLAELQDVVASACGIDLDARAVRFAADFAPDVAFRVQEVGALEPRFELVTCVETLEHIPDEVCGSFLHDVADRVAVGGHLVLTVPTTVRPVHEKHYRHYDTESVKDVLEALPGEWMLGRLEEIVPHRRWLDQGLRIVSNRHWTLDVPVLNRQILALHHQPVTRRRRGLHVLAVVQRCG